MTALCVLQGWRTGRMMRFWRRCWPCPSRSTWTAWNTRAAQCTERGRPPPTAADGCLPHKTLTFDLTSWLSAVQPPPPPPQTAHRDRAGKNQTSNCTLDIIFYPGVSTNEFSVVPPPFLLSCPLLPFASTQLRSSFIPFISWFPPRRIWLDADGTSSMIGFFLFFFVLPLRKQFGSSGKPIRLMVFPELFELWASGQNADPNSWQDPSHRGSHNRNVHVNAPAWCLPVRSLKLFHCMVPKLFTLALLLVNNACFLVFFFFFSSLQQLNRQVCKSVTIQCIKPIRRPDDGVFWWWSFWRQSYKILFVWAND